MSISDRVQNEQLLRIHRNNLAVMSKALGAARAAGLPTLHIETQIDSTRAEIARLEQALGAHTEEGV